MIYSGLKLKTAPSVEPVTLAQVRAQLRLEDDETDMDTSITLGIQSAREAIEKYLSRALITQTWEVTFTDFRDVMELPWGSPQSVTSIKYYDSDNVQQTLATSVYQVDTYSTIGNVTLKYGQVWPEVYPDTKNCVIIEYVAGYGDAATNVPATIRQAIISYCVDYYEHPEGMIEIEFFENKDRARALSLYRLIEAHNAGDPNNAIG